MTDGTVPDIYEVVIADLESKIAAMRATIENLQSLRSGAPPAKSSASNPDAPRIASSANFEHDAFFGMTATEAAKKYLAATKKTAPIGVLSQALLNGGWKSVSKNVNETLRVTLGRNPDFVKVNAEFGLAEWYPGRRATTSGWKRMTQSPSGDSEIVVSRGAENSFVERDYSKET